MKIYIEENYKSKRGSGYIASLLSEGEEGNSIMFASSKPLEIGAIYEASVTFETELKFSSRNGKSFNYYGAKATRPTCLIPAWELKEGFKNGWTIEMMLAEISA